MADEPSRLPAHGTIGKRVWIWKDGNWVAEERPDAEQQLLKWLHQWQQVFLPVHPRLALPTETWMRMVPSWIARRLFPEQLDAGEQASLDLLMRLEPPVSKETARKLIGGGTERFRKIWRCFPKERKLNPGRQEGFRLSDAAAQLLRLRMK